MTKINWSAIFVACIVVFGVLFGASMFAQPTTAEDRIITAQGDGKQYFEPDQGVVIIKIERRNDSAAEAKNLTATVIQKVLEALDQLVIKREDIETSDYRVYQNSIWVNNTRVWTDYTATCTIKATIKDIDKIGDVIDSSVEAGALINSIDFEISNEKINGYKAVVMGLAAKDARNKAESVILNLGHTIGEVKSVSFGYQYTPYRYWAYNSGLSYGPTFEEEYRYTPPTEIEIKNLAVSATLTVEFQIM